MEQDHTSSDTRPFVVLIAGPIASGKSTIAGLLTEKFDCHVTRFSNVLRELAETEGKEATNEVLQELYEKYRHDHGDDFLPKIMCNRLRTNQRLNGRTNIVAEGARLEHDFNHLRDFAKERGSRLKFIYLDSPPEVRLKRYNERRRREGFEVVSAEEFKETDAHYCESELERLAIHAKTPVGAKLHNGHGTSIKQLDEALQVVLSW